MFAPQKEAFFVYQYKDTFDLIKHFNPSPIRAFLCQSRSESSSQWFAAADSEDDASVLKESRKTAAVFSAPALSQAAPQNPQNPLWGDLSISRNHLFYV